jgi:hypothetical protein
MCNETVLVFFMKNWVRVIPGLPAYKHTVVVHYIREKESSQNYSLFLDTFIHFFLANVAKCDFLELICITVPWRNTETNAHCALVSVLHNRLCWITTVINW